MLRSLRPLEKPSKSTQTWPPPTSPGQQPSRFKPPSLLQQGQAQVRRRGHRVGVILSPSTPSPPSGALPKSLCITSIASRNSSSASEARPPALNAILGTPLRPLKSGPRGARLLAEAKVSECSQPKVSSAEDKVSRWIAAASPKSPFV